MNSHQNHEQLFNKEESMLKAMELGGLFVVSFTIKAAVEMNLFEIIAEVGPQETHLSPSNLASNVGVKNLDAPVMIDRLLCFLASYSVVTCKFLKNEDGRGFRIYGLGHIGKQFIKDEDGVSIAPLLLEPSSKILKDIWFYIAESIVEGGKTAFERAHGKPPFESMAIDESLQGEFNKMMTCHTRIFMKKVLQIYNGFESLNDAVLVNVGGSVGSNLGLIISKYPRIKGINFDMPHVVKDAPHVPGVEHVGGDMFKQIPQAKAIFMKWILHDWSDEKSIKILKNCWKALPTYGKVILFESILPERVPEKDLITKNALNYDVTMMAATVGGKERTKKEFEVLAREAGFAPPKIICGAYSHWIIELYKN